jgi:hypothetical protein
VPRARRRPMRTFAHSRRAASARCARAEDSPEEYAEPPEAKGAARASGDYVRRAGLE